MGKNQSASGLTNVIQYNNGNITFVSGSTTLMSISSSGAITTTGVISGSNVLTASYANNAELLDGLDSTAFATTGAYSATSGSLYTVSSSAYATSGSLSTASGSFNTRVSALEATGSALSSSILSVSSSAYATSGSLSATSGSLSAASGSFNTRVSALEVTGSALSSSILSVSSSAYATSGSLSTDSGSFNSRVASLETYSTNLTAKTASFATTGSNTFIGSQVVSGSLTASGSITATGTITAQTLVVQTITSSVVYSSGSNVFGNDIGNSQRFTGSVLITGSLTIAGGSSATSYSGATVYGSTVVCSPIGCFATSCATSFIGGTMSGTTIYGSTAVCSPVGKFTTCIDACVGYFSSSVTANNLYLTSTGAIYFNEGLALFPYGGHTYIRPYSASGSINFQNQAGSLLVTMLDGGNVGIGNTTPSAKLQIEGVNDTYWGQLTLRTTNTATQNIGGMIAFGGFHNSVSNASNWAAILGAKENANANDNASYLNFQTQTSGGSITEKMRITSTGDLWFTGRSTTANYQSVFYNDNSQFAINATNTSTGKTINFNPSNTLTAMAITSTGNVGIGTTPSLWANGTESALQIKKASIYEYGNYEVGLQVNAFYNTDVSPAGWKYISTGAQCISQLQLSGGDLNYNVANPGTAGCGITWSTKFNITRAGLVGIGTATTPKAILSVEQDITTTAEFGSFGQFIINGKTNANKLLSFGFNTATDVGFIQAMVNGTSYNNLLLNARGGNIGIGTTSVPSDHILQIHSTCSYGRMALTNTSTGVASGDGLIFQMEHCFAIIKNQETSCLVLGTNGRETDIVIDTNGGVGIGQNPINKFTILAGNTNVLDLFDTGAGFGIGMQAMNSAATVYRSWDFYASKYQFFSGQSIFSCQICALSGVKFGNGSGTLNYYEQGTWTPRLKNGSFTTNAGAGNSGWYTRIGNLVTVGGTLDWGAGSGAQDGNSLQIACLPFASSNTSDERNVGQFGAPAANSIGFKCTGKGQVVLVNDPGASYIYLIETFQNGTYSTYIHNLCVANAGTIYGFQITYHI